MIRPPHILRLSPRGREHLAALQSLLASRGASGLPPAAEREFLTVTQGRTSAPAVVELALAFLLEGAAAKADAVGEAR